ncbi:hypothetical protein [Undibacterium sp. YM2]|uniref:hypothetical protein n=1 Tax=Undibacterium sp. YM2 TaxID=2058625 RepID=UPI001389CBE8|nr:hypothetical protein [Undibacterium sp. YM2]
MFGSQVLETAIGIALFFLAVSLFVTAIQEFIATALKLRANTLSSGINELLEQKKNLDPVIQAIVNHPGYRRSMANSLIFHRPVLLPPLSMCWVGQGMLPKTLSTALILPWIIYQPAI